MDPDLHVQDIVTVPLTIWVIGIVVWFVAAVGRRNGKGGRWKWILAYGIVVFSAYAAWSGLGSDPLRNLGMGPYVGDSFVRSEYSSNKLLFFLFTSFFGPIMTLPALYFADRIENKRMRDIVS
ncbi:MAG TPA: hypothetical protein VKT78_02730 [Fimbriimonadaceae bacterium]|nr:hypothetical protein [Fimbriimonadaceae bacterium]